MDWLEGMNAAIDYIEDNLDKEISFNKAAKIACCSSIHFQRMFSYLAGMGLSEYIRQRRMTLAAFDLLSSSKKVIDIALTYGYNSPTAFTRAFVGVHGIPPSLVRVRGVPLKSFPRIKIQVTIIGGKEMKYAIEEKQAMRFVGIKETISTIDGQNLIRIPQMWQEVLANETCSRILELSNQKPYGVVGICANFREAEFDYYIASSTDLPIPPGMEELTVAAGLWVVFECVGPTPDAIQNVFKKVYSEWFPSSGYEHTGTAEIEWYSEGDTKAADYLSEIWIPIMKKRDI